MGAQLCAALVPPDRLTRVETEQAAHCEASLPGAPQAEERPFAFRFSRFRDPKRRSGVDFAQEISIQPLVSHPPVDIGQIDPIGERV